MDFTIFIRSELFMVTLTFLLFWLYSRLQAISRITLLNPMVLTIASLIVFLKFTGISYEEYYKGGHMIEFWLKPAIVALALPLYNELRHIRRQLLPLLLAELAGCVVGIVAVVVIAGVMGAGEEVVRSLAPKSVSTPIAIEISHQIGGIPALTSAIVVVVGMIGSVVGLKMMTWGRVKSPVSRSLSMGTAAHVMGTNRVSQYGERFGAYATIGLIINGVLTAFLADPIVELIYSFHIF
ncbi:MAG: LrgB family protein [Muribaculaceae bacterium]|nr:LrgB family protein [Muribaculaceae bacterium]